jgi:hypothetical protein
MRGGIEADVWNATPVELREQRAKPVRVLVVDGDRFHVL